MIPSRPKSSTWLAGCLVVGVCLLIGAALGSLAGYVVASMTFQSAQTSADPTGLIVPTGSSQAGAAAQQVIITDPSASAAAVSKVLPAVVTVLEGLNLPRYPSVPAKLRAQRKPLEASSPTRLPARLEKVRLVVPEGQSKQAEILGRGPEAAPAVVQVLQRIGVA